MPQDSEDQLGQLDMELPRAKRRRRRRRRRLIGALVLLGPGLWILVTDLLRRFPHIWSFDRPHKYAYFGTVFASTLVWAVLLYNASRRRGLLAELSAGLAAARALLAEMEAGPREQTLTAARANLRALEEELELAELMADRRRELVGRNAISGEEADRAETDAPGIGALRLRLVATKGGEAFSLRGEDGKYLPHVLLDLDYWALMPI